MRQRKRGTGQYLVYTYPTKAALAAVKVKVRTLTQGATDQSLSVLVHRLNPVLRGWTAYFRHGVSKATFNYLRAFVWRRVVWWLRHMVAPSQAPSRQLEAAPAALPPGVVADGGRGDPVRPGCGDDQPLPLPARAHPLAVGRASGAGYREGHRLRSWRAGCVATPTPLLRQGPRPWVGRVPGRRHRHRRDREGRSRGARSGVGDSDDGAFWTAFLRSLRVRGLSGVRSSSAMPTRGSRVPSPRSCSAPPGSDVGCISYRLTGPRSHASAKADQGHRSLSR